MAFQSAGIGAFRQAYMNCQPAAMEPIMKVEIETPTEFQGSVVGNISSRRGIIMGTREEQNFSMITSEVPLSEMFGYVGDLRSLTQGKAEFTMEFAKYAKVPKAIEEKLMADYQQKLKDKNKY